MSEVEKQESQKTVVAFISGLLIGGLLVWVFSSSPETAVAPEVEEETQEEVVAVEGEVSEVAQATSDSETTNKIQVGEGSVIVPDQAAGNTIVIGSIALPTANGWIVAREFIDGTSGNILGAARYSSEEGLVPNTIELIRGTTAGNTYQVVFFTNDGDSKFDLGEDVLIEGIATTFNAQ